MAREVIMPALGMAQESGVIVSWLKSPGDAVKSGDALMEVETDKAVMEVEAQADGFLTDVRAAEGDEVPVGQVIALISDSPGEAGGGDKASSTEDASAPPAESKPAASSQAAAPESAAAEKAQKPDPAPVGKPNGSTNGRVLASPKARRLAGEQGLDLRRLADAGHPQPYRAADIETLKAMGSAATAPSATAKAQANLPAAAYQRFLDLISAETDVPSGTVVAAFAAGALRATGGLGTVTVRVVTPRLADLTFVDADRGRLSDLVPEADAAVPDMIVFDLTGTRVTEVDLSASIAPAVSVARDGDRVVISIAATAAQLGDDALVTCLDDLAGRFEDPLRHLL